MKEKSFDKGQNKKPIPRWKEDISPLKNDAFFWNAVWISAGKPQNTALHAIMKHTRKKYHLQIKKIKECWIR